MPWAKRDIIDAAMTEIGMGEYVFDVQPEELQDALARLDAMLAVWEAKGIDTGYTVVDDAADVVLTGDSNIAEALVEPVILGLAVRLAPMYGKTVSPDTKQLAKAGYSQALSDNVTTPKTSYSVRAAPAGAGWKNDDNKTTLAEPDA